jgi:uncharacterized protein (DUF433 family)
VTFAESDAKSLVIVLPVIITGEAKFMITRIVSDPAILSGKACIKGTRISVEMILEWIASGGSRDDVIRSYPQLTSEDIEEALRYAAQAVNGESMFAAEIFS